MRKSKITLVMVLAIAVLAITGCGKAERWVATQTGGGYTTCIDGINYIQFTSGATVKIDRITKLPQECK
ncbi:MAG: hypothetical protein PHC28_12240 [Flavobacterium sp.]|uniref:hypothetical protein n=1 Tax=Flavobacterium sp. TaxID=239 RepID=UPI002614D7B2|nr:hypothetical protein [Flavobacterium sp.]MDD5151223.1 hypothetical protein [Flavobacterium sp.]